MSYILDALKKSETERQKGTPPGVHTVQPLPAYRVRKRRVWLYILMAALLFNAGILVALHPWGRMGTTPDKPGRDVASPEPSHLGKQTTAVTQSAEQPQMELALPKDLMREKTSPPLETSAPTSPSVPSAAPGKESSIEASNPQPRAQTPVSQGEPTPAAAPARGLPKRPKPTVKPADQSVPESTAIRPPATVATEDRRKDSRIEIPALASTLSTADETDRAQPKDPRAAELQELPPGRPTGAPGNPPRKEVAHSDGEKARDLYDLPATLRNELPRLSVSFLVYSRQPEERMVTINGKKMREGDEVSTGLKLEEITPDGAVLSWKGRKFRKGVF